MEEEIKVDEKFKSAFNLGYSLAEELNLKTPILENQEKIIPSNPMHLGMQQYIDEAKHFIKQQQNKSAERDINKSPKKKSGKNRGRGLSF